LDKYVIAFISQQHTVKLGNLFFPSLVMNEKVLTNQKIIANLFNNYFLSVADSSNVDNNKAQNSSMINPINYLFKYYLINDT
jgi:hypothetical protein